MIKKYFFSKTKVKIYMHYSKRYNMMPMPLFEYNNHFCSHSADFVHILQLLDLELCS
jgi:hypothetical protein